MESALRQRARRLRTTAGSLALQRAWQPARLWALRHGMSDSAALQLAQERALLAWPRSVPTLPHAKERAQSLAPPQRTKDAAALQLGTEPTRRLRPQRGAN